MKFPTSSFSSIFTAGRPFRSCSIAMLLAVLLAPLSARACDLCAVHSLLSSAGYPPAGSFTLGLSEQWTAYDSVERDGKEVDDPEHQFLHSSITQLSSGYSITDSVGLQLTLPVIAREFRTVEDGERKRGSVSGIGDLSVLGRGTVFRNESSSRAIVVAIFGGLRLPTGETGALHEEEGENHADARLPSTLHGGEVHEDGDEAEVPSAVHGHDLSEGSGAVDVLLGAETLIRWERFFVSGGTEFAIRGAGAFDYRYANTISWHVTSSVAPYMNDDGAVLLGVRLSGEAKGRDVQHGDREQDTGARTVFLGPEVSWSSEGSFELSIGADLPIERDGTGTQVVADSRLRVELAWTF